MKDRTRIIGWLIVLILGGAVLWTYPQSQSQASHDDSFSNDALYSASLSKPMDTQMAAHADVPLVPSQNVLWCGTMQLVWNKAIDLVGEKLHFTSPSPLADSLNRMEFTDLDLDSDSYVAIADFEKNSVEDEIRAALEKTFQGTASPELIPEVPSNPGPSDFLAYAYLYKNLVFSSKFKIQDPLAFDGHRVETFGFDTTEKNYRIFDEVEVCFYQSEDNFILKLKTGSLNDEFILAKIAPGPTLKDTIARVLTCIKNASSYHPEPGDQLSIPRLNFKLKGDFPDLENHILQPSDKAKIHPNPPLYIKRAEQFVRFQLNEKGAILKSEAVMQLVMAGSSGVPASPRIPLVLKFDKPFLILMKRANSSHPYFALWVGNATLLVPAKFSLF